MKAVIAKKWVKALRSKRYKQVKGYLKVTTNRGSRHCCLGVLCELYQAERKREKKPLLSVEDCRGKDWDPRMEKSATVTAFGAAEETQTLPQRVMRWAGMKDDSGYLRGRRVVYGRQRLMSLACLNDEGCSFAKIADVIEARVKDL